MTITLTISGAPEDYDETTRVSLRQSFATLLSLPLDKIILTLVPGSVRAVVSIDTQNAAQTHNVSGYSHDRHPQSRRERRVPTPQRDSRIDWSHRANNTIANAAARTAAVSAAIPTATTIAAAARAATAQTAATIAALTAALTAAALPNNRSERDQRVRRRHGRWQWKGAISSLEILLFVVVGAVVLALILGGRARAASPCGASEAGKACRHKQARWKPPHPRAMRRRARSTV